MYKACSKDVLGYDENFWAYSDFQKKRVFVNYNGNDSYGDEIFNAYAIFDKYNKKDPNIRR